MAKMLWYLLHKQSPQHRKEVRITMRNFHSSTHPLRRTTALAMCAVLLLGSIPAFAVDDGVKPTYDEAYYAMTDYYGNLTDGSVVKSYTTNGAESLTDYGDYDEIVNLTNGLVPTTAAGKAVFQFAKDAIPDHFYFEGKTAKPFAQLPWTLAVHYTLNGVPTKAEDLAGKTGVVEISIDAIPNENASEYARNNYTLEAMAVFNQDDILSLEAPGAQVQLVGNLRAVLFIGLPGEECHFTIRVGSDDFSFSGMTFLMVPATLSQLSEIAKLSERKDDLEDNYQKLSKSLDVLLDSMNGISSSLYATANGLDQLNTARGTVSSGKADLYEKADAVRGDLDALKESLDAMPDHLDTASKLVDDTNRSLGSVNTALHDVQKQLKSIQDELDELRDELDAIRRAGNSTASDLKSLGRHIDQLKSKTDSLLDEIAALNIKVNGGDITLQGMTAAQLSAKLSDAKTLETLYLATKDGKLTQEQFIAKMLLLNGTASGEAQATAMAKQLEALSAQVDAAVAQAMEAAPELTQDAALAAVLATTLPKEQQSYYRQAKQLEALYAAVKAGMSEETFFLTVLPMTGMTTAQAKQNWELFQKSNSLSDSVIELADLFGTSGLTGHTAKLLTEAGKTLDNLDDVSDDIDDLLDGLDDVLDAADELHDIMDKNVPELKQTLTDTKTVLTTLSTTVSDTNDFLGTFEELLKTSGTQLDAGTKQTLEGLAAALRATARSLNTTGDVKSAKNNIGDIIEDTWNEYTGDVNNLLLMDANAEAVSLTDTRNDSPQSIQVLIRTKEIKKDDGAKAEIEVETAAQTTFWGRVAQIFRDFWAAITGIFKGKD